MQRRQFLRALGSLAAFEALQGLTAAIPFASLRTLGDLGPLGKLAAPYTGEYATAHAAELAPEKKYERYVDHISAIPILAFYRIHDTPRFPEDISTQQLATVFAHAWALGYRPVNMSDIMLGRVDAVVAKGFKPLGITCDGAHASTIFSMASASKGTDRGPLGNAQSFVEIFANSLQNIALPRATFFLSIPRGKKTSGYFGSVMPLKDIADVLQVMPHIEFAYQTKFYTSLGGVNGPLMRKIVEFQMEELQKERMLERVMRIMAYPYSARPTDAGLMALRDLQFMGGVLTYPGVGEAHHTQVPQCLYDGKLMMDSFHVPRVVVGSHVYAPGTKPVKNPPTDPVEDFTKDVVKAIPKVYVSRG